jgi:hypothetical protein
MTTSILKRTALLCSFIATGFMAEAQYFTFAPEIGAGATSATLSAPPAIIDPAHATIKTTSDFNANFKIGLAVAFQFDQFWSINSGAFYQYIEPTFVQGTQPSTTITDKMNYINIPLEIVHINSALKKGFYYGIGVNFGLPISGTDERVTNNGTPSVKTTIKFDGLENATFGNNYTHYNFLNVGAVAKVGYFFGKTYLGVEANLGLSNISPNSNSKYKINTYGVHVGYIISKKKPRQPAVPQTDSTSL